MQALRRQRDIAPIAALVCIALATCQVAPPVRVTEPVDRALEDVREAVGLSALLRQRDGITLHGTRTLFDRSGAVIGEHPTSLAFHPSGSFVLTVGAEGGASSRGFDGTDAWSSDSRGITRVHALGSREQMLADGWIRTMHWLTPSANRFGVAFDEDLSTPARHVALLRNGDTLLQPKVEIDRTTSLPLEFSMTRGGILRRVTWSDWRGAGGVRMPHRIEEFTGDRLEHRDVFDHRSSGTPRTFGAPRSQPVDATFRTEISPAIETRLDSGGRFYALTSIVDRAGKDRAAWMLLDTGFGMHAIHSPLADQIGTPEPGEVALHGASESGMSRLVVGSGLSIGPLTLRSPTFVSIDTAFLSRRAGFEVQGILGTPLFDRAVVVLDEPRRRVEVHDPAQFPSGATAWEPVAMDGTSPCVTGTITADRSPTPPLWFRIDTGSDDTVTVAYWANRRYDIEGERSMLQSAQITGVFGTLRGWRKPVTRAAIGGLLLSRPSVTLLRGATDGPLGDPWIAGNVGTRALVGHRVTFDLLHSRLSFGRMPPPAGRAAQSASPTR